MRRWWWHHETHARGVTRISLDRQPGDKRVTNTPEITPGNGEITPRMRIWTFLLPASTCPVLCPQQGPLSNPGWREEKRLEALTSDQTLSLMQQRDLGKVSRWRCVPYSGKTLIVVKHSPPLPNIPWELCQATGVITKWSCRGRQRDDSHNFSVIFLRNRDGSLTPEYIKISTYKWRFWKV